MTKYTPCPGTGKPAGESKFSPGIAICPHCTKYCRKNKIGDKTPRHKEVSPYRYFKY